MSVRCRSDDGNELATHCSVHLGENFIRQDPESGVKAQVSSVLAGRQQDSRSSLWELVDVDFSSCFFGSLGLSFGEGPNVTISTRVDDGQFG